MTNKPVSLESKISKFKNVGFCPGRKTGECMKIVRERIRASKRHRLPVAPSLGFEFRSHWWEEASSLLYHSRLSDQSQNCNTSALNKPHYL